MNLPTNGMRFWIRIDQIEVASFAECSPIVIETETEEFREGGRNEVARQLPKRTRYRNLIFSRGIDEDRSLYQWYLKTVEGKPQRLPVSIILYNDRREAIRQWNLRGAFPVKWMGPNLNASFNELAVERLEIAFEEMTQD